MTAQPLPATALIWPQALLPTPLSRFVLLAVLLHVWLVLMLGNAPGGTAQEGQGVFGSLNVTLEGAATGAAGQPQPPQMPATPTGARGDADQQRFGGAVRATLPPEAAQPGAAQLGDWSPVQGGLPDGRTAVAAPEATLAPTPTPAPPADAQPPAAATAPSTFGTATELGLQRHLNATAPAARTTADAVNGAPMPRVAPATVAAVPDVPALQATAVAAPLKQVPAAVQVVQAAPVAALRPATAAAAVPTPVLAAVPVPTAPLPAPSAEKQLTSRLPADRAGAAAPLADVGRASTAPLLAAVPVPVGAAAASVVAPAAAPPLPAPATVATPVPVAAALPVPAVASSPVPVVVSSPVPAVAVPAAAAVASGLAAPAQPAAPLAQLPRLAPGASSSVPQPALPSSATAPAPASTVPLASPPRPGPALPSLATSSPGQGAPDAGSRLGKDVATLPSTPASAPKRLNLELPRLRGGELSRYSTTGLLPALPRPPEVPDKLGSAIEKTAKEDCRKAHAGAGLLAVVPLAVDALREGGCKW